MDFLEHLINPAQKSEAWFDQRLGRFTSSEVYKLMPIVKREMTAEELAKRPKTGTGSRTTTIEEPTLLSDGAKTYIRAKVAELLTGVRETIISPALDWGNANEPKARETFVMRTGIQVREREFVPFLTFAGGSVDGETEPEQDVDAIIEIKCPYYSYNHIENVTEIIRSENPTAKLKEIHFEYYAQVQANMLYLEKEQAIFISYDPRFDEPMDLAWCIIKRDIDFQQLLLLKLETANTFKEETLTLLKG